jgi:hypothetical protein
MPGMAEPNLAIDIVKSAPDLSEVQTNHSTGFTPRPRLAGYTVRLIGMDAATTACAAFLCFALFGGGREP